MRKKRLLEEREGEKEGIEERKGRRRKCWRKGRGGEGRVDERKRRRRNGGRKRGWRKRKGGEEKFM